MFFPGSTLTLLLIVHLFPVYFNTNISICPSWLSLINFIAINEL